MTTADHRGRARGRLLALGAVCALALVLTAPAAGAVGSQTPTTACDPTYGCTATTPPSTTPPTSTPGGVSCHAAFHGTPGGAQYTVVDGPRNAPVVVTFNGTVVGSGVTDANGDATIPFRLPAGSPGNYVVTVTGPGFTASCDPPVHYDGGVGGVHQNNGGGNQGGGFLAFTGFHLLLWVLLAAGLVSLGVAIRRAGERRRRYYSVH